MTTPTMQVIRMTAFGGPEVLKYQPTPRPVPAEGPVLVRATAAGVNFIDVYQRTGRYPNPLPFIPGSEAAGIAGVTEFRPGDPVA